MPPKAVVYHICGQHLAGEAVVGYAVGPDTPVLLSPKLVLRGGAVVQRRPALAAPILVLRGRAAVGGRPPGPIQGTPILNLRGRTTGLQISSTLAMGIPELLLLGGVGTVGKEAALVPTRPVNWLLDPTTLESDIQLPPTEEEDWLLVPTTEVLM